MATFSNQASLSYGGRTTNSNIVTGEITDAVSAEKTALTQTYRPGQRIPFVIRIQNGGLTPFTSVSLSDNLGAYLYDGTTLVPLSYVEGSLLLYINGMPADAPSVSQGPPLTVQNLTVPPMSTALLFYETEVTAYAPMGEGASITNSATVSGCGIPEPLCISATLSVSDAPFLVLSKSLCPLSVQENSQLTYTFVVQNIGASPAVATENITVTDVLNPTLSNLSVTYNDTAWQSGVEYTYDETSGLFTTLPGQITVPAAVFSQNPATGTFDLTPGVATLRITGTV